MSLLPLLLVLASALAHATWNAMLKRRSDAQSSAALLSLGATVLAGCAALAFEREPLPASAWAWTAASSAIEAAYFVTLARAMSLLPLGTAYGLSRGGGQLVTWPVSLTAFGERAEATAIAGAGVLTLGLFARAHRPESRAGLGWALACAFAIGLYPLTYKAALTAGAPPCTLFALSMLGAVPAQVALMSGSRRDRLARCLRERWGSLALASVLCAVSFIVFLYALRLEGAGRLAALRNTSVVFAALLGLRAGERLDARALVSTLAIATGAILVSW